MDAGRGRFDSREVWTGSGTGGPPVRCGTAGYAAGIDEVWDALTNPVRLPRWFAGQRGVARRRPVPGRGQRRREVLECEKPSRAYLTWSSAGDQLARVDLDRSGGRTRVGLEHVAPVTEHMNTYGPGAVGVGWDLSFPGWPITWTVARRPAGDEEELLASPEDGVRGDEQRAVGGRQYRGGRRPGAGVPHRLDHSLLHR